MILQVHLTHAYPMCRNMFGVLWGVFAYTPLTSARANCLSVTGE